MVSATNIQKKEHYTMFPLDSLMYEGKELGFNQEYQALYVPRCWWHWLLNSSVMTLVKLYLSLKQNLDLTC